MRRHRRRPIVWGDFGVDRHETVDDALAMGTHVWVECISIYQKFVKVKNYRDLPFETRGTNTKDASLMMEQAFLFALANVASGRRLALLVRLAVFGRLLLQHAQRLDQQQL